MFVQIYTRIALAIVCIVGGLYFIFQFQYKQKLISHSQSLLKGSLILIAEGYQRQKATQREDWIASIRQLTGLQFDISKITEETDTRWSINLAKNSRQLDITFVHLNLKIQFSIDAITEQHYRIIALLAHKELARQKKTNIDENLSRLSKMFDFPFTLTSDISSLSQQQRLQVNQGNVVVDNDDWNNFAMVYYKINDQRFLEIGPISKFNALSQNMLIAYTIVGLILLSIVTYLLVHRLEKRLIHISKILERFGHSHELPKIPITGTDVIDRLGTKVNEMSLRIIELLNNQKEMNQAVSHELRTPLSRIKFRVQLLNDMLGDIDASEKESILEKTQGIEKDISQLETLIDDILSLYRLDTPSAQRTRLPFDISSLIESVIDIHRDNDRNINVSRQLEKNISVFGSAQDTARLIENLLTNALKYTHSKVEVRLEKVETEEGQACHLIVEDDGNGIPEDQRDKVFNAFSRLQDAKTKQGYGLGLTIASKVAKFHKGKISIERSRLGGAKFIYSFPILVSAGYPKKRGLDAY